MIVSMLLFWMTAVELPVAVEPGMPVGEVRVAGYSSPATTPIVSQSPQFRSRPAAAK